MRPGALTLRMTANANNPDSATFKVKPIGIYRNTVDRGHNSANAQHPDGVVCNQPQPYGYRHHPVHHIGTHRDPAPHSPSDPSDAGNEHPSAQVAGYPRTLSPGPHSGIPGDHAGLPRGRSQPYRLFGAACGTDAHPIRLVPRPGTNLVQQAGRFDRVVGEDICFCALLVNLYRCSAELGLPMAGFGRIRPSNTTHTDNGVRFHLGPTKNDHDSVNGPAAAGQSDHDVVDDAADDCLFLFDLPQWTGPVLDRFQPHWHRNTIFYNRVDSFVPAVPQGGAGRCDCPSGGRTGTGRGARGDCGTWKCA